VANENLAVVSHAAQPTESDQELTRIFSAYTVCATIWLVFATAVGVLLALKLVYPELAGSAPWLTFGRLRPIHTNDTFYAWASPAMIGLALYIAAKSSGTRLYSAKLAWITLILLNVAAIAGTVALDLGYNNGAQEYREWLWWIRVILGASLVLTAWNLIATVARRVGKDIYLANWYTIGGTLWTIIIVLITLAPWYQKGLGQVAVQGYYMHNAVGMWFTPLCLGVFYYALPKAMNRPIYSYSLGIFAFWTNLAFYPLLGAHHFLFSPLPWWLQTTAIIASVAMFVPVWGGSANYLLTMRGRPERLHRAPAMFILVGVLGYLIGSSQGTIEAFRSMQAIWHFTNYTVGHSHLTMYGFVTFAIWGGIYELLPRATGRQPDNLLLGVHFWLATVGVLVYVGALSIGGTVQGLDWVAGKPFIQSVVDMAPYWLWRSVGGVLMFLSHLVFAWNVWDMTYRRRRAPGGAAHLPDAVQAGA
jgi:cytochrome c oxidase cbb3-type subunit 1